jgi:alkanesulfonate monooxygenase SsuD/methylene tetrahydromethanopterin reductase-like flavin-dependent oxidoreductase (luciferase family)
MKIGVMLPIADVPSGEATWPTIRSFAQAAERGGLDSVWVCDHFFHDWGDGSPLQTMHEGWTMLVAVAATTERIQVGSIVLSAGFRHPGLLAKMAASADEVSDGRVILGIGAG